MNDAEGVQFLQWCLLRLRLVWPGYRKVQRHVYRRIQRRLQDLGLPSLADYRTYLEAHPDEWAVLDSYCWISLSRFYRDKSVFQLLEREVLPSLAQQALARGEHDLRCWSLGCASGEEPYSLSLLWRLNLQPQFSAVRLVILATDIDQQAIARARRGCYSPGSLKDLPESWRSRGFDRTAEEFCIRQEFREPVTFLAQDIRESAPEETFALILCRNLAFTYFDAALQGAALRQLTNRLRPGGALLIGRGESLPEGEFNLLPWSEKENVYRLAPPAAGSLPA